MIHHRDTHHAALFLLAFMLAVRVRLVDGFLPTVNPKMRTVDTYHEMATQKRKTKSDIMPSVGRNPFRDVDVDIEKAKDVVDHFGDYSEKQMEQMRDDLHAHRVQSLVFGDDHASPDEMLQERILEEELTLQLHLLQSQTPDAYLFPEVTTRSDGQELKELLPHVQDGTSVAKLEHEKEVFFWEEMMEEGVLESLAICSMIACLMAAPHILQ